MIDKQALKMALYASGAVAGVLIVVAGSPWWASWIPALIMLPFFVRDVRGFRRQSRSRGIDQAREQTWALGLPFPEADGTLSRAPVEPPAALRLAHLDAPEEAARRLRERRMLAEVSDLLPDDFAEIRRQVGEQWAGSAQSDSRRTASFPPQVTRPMPKTVQQVRRDRWAVGKVMLPQGWTPNDWHFAVMLSRANFADGAEVTFPTGLVVTGYVLKQTVATVENQGRD